jgi:hypothetical protein
VALSFGARMSSCSSDILLQVSVAVQTVSDAIFPATAVGASKYFASLLFRSVPEFYIGETALLLKL